MDKLIIYSDGGSRGNPGPGGAGYLICDSQKNKLKGRGVFLGSCTNNHAEYMGLIEALKDAQTFSPENVTIYCDSQLLVRQIQGAYKVKSPNLKPLYQQVMSLLDGFDNWQIDHVYREDNKHADMMANKAMDLKEDVEEIYQSVSSQPTDKLKLAVLLSGGGTTMVNVNDQIASGQLNAEISVVISSRSNVKGVERAEKIGAPIEIIRRKDYGNVQDFSDSIEKVLNDNSIDLVIQAGWLCLWNIPSSYENKVMNIHPSLLPSFGGQGMWGHHVHEAVLARGCKVSGCTVHFCTNEYDQGPIIIQRSCPVIDTDTADVLAARVFEQECLAYPQAIKLFEQGKLKVQGQIVRISD